MNPTKKRILMFNWRDTRHKDGGGAEIYIHEIGRRWVKQGHEVTLFCGNSGQSPREETIDGIRIIRRGSFSLVYVWAFIYYVTRFRNQFDMILDCHNGIPFFTPLYSRKPVYCLVHHVHQDIFKEYLSAPAARLAIFLEKVVMPFVYRSCQYVTVSQSSKDAMVAQLGIDVERIQIVYNGVDLQQFIPGESAVAPTVLYVGRLKAYKSVDVLVRAFVAIVAQRPDAQLLIAGAGDAEADLQDLVHALKMENCVKFLGRISDQQKIVFMQRAWVFCNPSFAEGWGITTIEANACGTPIVASDVAGLRDSVDDPRSGYLVPYRDSDAFARKILTLISNEKKRRSMSKYAVRWAQKFDWQVSADNLMQVFESTPRNETVASRPRWILALIGSRELRPKVSE